MAEASVSPSPSLPSCCRPDSHATSFIQPPCLSSILEPLPPLLLLPFSPSALLGLAACAPSVHHLVLFTFPPPLPSLSCFLPHAGLLPSVPPSSPSPTFRQRALSFSPRPPSPLASIFPTAAPPLLPSSYPSRHCRRAPGVPQTLFSTIKLLSLPLPGSCKNNLG